MRARIEPLALDTSVLVAFFLEEEKLHEKAFRLVEFAFEGSFACISAVNVAEIGYVLERVTEDKDFAQNCMHAVCYEMPIDVLPLSWEFMRTLAHLKAVNAISFCDNATLAAIKGLIVSQYDFGEEEREKTNHGIPTSRSNVRSFCTEKLPLNN